MKKVFALIAIVGFVACNNASTDAAKANAEKATADSLAALAPKVDTTKKDTTAVAPAAPVEAPKK